MSRAGTVRHRQDRHDDPRKNPGAGWGGMLLIGGLLLSPPPTPAEPPRTAPAIAPPPSGAAARLPASSLTVEEAIRTALVTHPALEETRYAYQAAQAITKQIKGDRYPWLEASVSAAAGSLRIVSTDGRWIHDRGGRGFDAGGALPKTNQQMLTGGLILNQLITDFGYTAHRIVASEATAAASQTEMLTKKAYVILNVQKAYLNCLLQQALVTIAQETVTRRQAIRDQVELLHRHQLKSKIDLDLITVEVANAELALIMARNDLLKNFAALNHAMGLQGTMQYHLAPVSLATPPPGDLDALVAEGLRERPELLGSRDKIQATEALLKSVKALHLGSISALGTIGISTFSDGADVGQQDSNVLRFWAGGATARLPLFTGFKIQNQVTEARHLKAEAEHDLENLLNDVLLQVIRGYHAHTTNAEHVVLEGERVGYAREALSLSHERYRLGLSPIIDVIRATTAVFEAESRLAEAQYLSKISEAVLAYAVGRDYRTY